MAPPKAPPNETHVSTDLPEITAIYLTQGQIALIDTADYPLIKGRRWHAWRNTDGEFEAVSTDRGKSAVRLARVILGIGPDVRIRYINGNRLDCRRINIDIISTAETRVGRRMNTWR